jgi:Fis family transcriptional regulator
MRQAHGNQLRASEMLGINRNTLRKKLQHYGLL